MLCLSTGVVDRSGGVTYTSEKARQRTHRSLLWSRVPPALGNSDENRACRLAAEYRRRRLFDRTIGPPHPVL